MKSIKAICVVAVALTLSACAGTEQVSRGTTPAFPVVMAPAVFSVDAVNVIVPESLKVSEAHLFYPFADIVWRGDVLGDRHDQVASIFTTGMGRGAKAFSGKRHVVVDIQVLRFHSLTERARYSVGGVHSIKFVMNVRDSQTGALLMDSKVIKADLNGYGGARAVAAEQRGLTQKVRITSHIAGVLQRELTQLSTRLEGNPGQMFTVSPSTNVLDDAA
ncbi:DUF6778 family protein [Falsihalocynthiibacter sp. S25ZX9]|uniref:DUF6778 family protein n=1 Tax=Falsihalocynthiibacter sp. S25ZX9 TaxID=3240870 RepID=UPI00350EECEF